MKSKKMSRRLFFRLAGKSSLGTAAACLYPEVIFGAATVDTLRYPQDEKEYESEKIIRLTIKNHTLIIR